MECGTKSEGPKEPGQATSCRGAREHSILDVTMELDLVVHVVGVRFEVAICTENMELNQKVTREPGQATSCRGPSKLLI